MVRANIKKESPPKQKVAKEDWVDRHSVALLRALTSQLLATRKDTYSLPELRGVADHGGERINKKIQAAIRRMCGEHAYILDEEMAKLKRKRSAQGSVDVVKEEKMERGGGEGKRRKVDHRAGTSGTVSP